RQIARVGVERVEVLDALVWIALRVLTRREHAHGREQDRTPLIRAPDVAQPRADLGRLLGPSGAVGGRDPAGIPLRLRAELIEEGRLDRPGAFAPSRIDADGVAILMGSCARAVRAPDPRRAIGVGTVDRGKGTAGPDAHAAPARARRAGCHAIDEHRGEHGLDVEGLHHGDLGADDESPVVPARLWKAVSDQTVRVGRDTTSTLDRGGRANALVLK